MSQKNTSTFRNVISALFRNWKEKRQYWKLQQWFFNLPVKYKNRMVFLSCFTLSCPDGSMQLLAGFDQRQRWNPKLCNYSCGLLFLKSNTQVYSWKKVAVGKKIYNCSSQHKTWVENLGLAVHCISETCTSHCIPSVISGHRYPYGKKIWEQTKYCW